MGQAYATLGQQMPLLANQQQVLQELLSGQAALSANISALSANVGALSANVGAISANVSALMEGQATLTARVAEVVQQLKHLDHVSAIRAVNSVQPMDGHLRAINRDGQPLRPNFPETPGELAALTAPTVNAFLDYYDIAAGAGAGVAARRATLGRYLGVSMKYGEAEHCT
jgi:regulator of replication initiation timing